MALDLSVKELLQVFVFADKFDIHTIQKYCHQRIVSSLSVENCILVLRDVCLMDRSCLGGLKNSVTNFILRWVFCLIFFCSFLIDFLVLATWMQWKRQKRSSVTLEYWLSTPLMAKETSRTPKRNIWKQNFARRTQFQRLELIKKGSLDCECFQGLQIEVLWDLWEPWRSKRTKCSIFRIKFC